MAGLASLASRAGLGGAGEKKTNAVIIELDDEGSPVLGETVASALSALNTGRLFPLRFQYFPESLSDTKQVNYQAKEIPGASLPVYQWISSGERSISFTAVFSSDTDLIDRQGNNKNELIGRQSASGIGHRNVDARSAVAWLRRLMLPEYIAGGADNGAPLAKAPPKLYLNLKNSGIGIAGGTNGAFSQPDAVLCILSQCDVNWEVFFPSGFPRLVSCSLTFLEVAQNAGRVSFPQRGHGMVDSIRGVDHFIGYKLGL